MLLRREVLADAPSGVAITGFGRPFGLATDADRNLLVADMDLHAVFRMDPGLTKFQHLGASPNGWSAWRDIGEGPGERAPRRAPGRFDGPHSVQPGDDGELYVTTYYTPGLHRVGADGASRLLAGPPDLVGPASTYPLGDGRLAVTDYGANAVLVFDAEGVFQGALGGGADGWRRRRRFEAGSGPGWLDRPHMCRAGPDGALIVVDTWNHRIEVFDADGRWRETRAVRGAPGLRAPVAADPVPGEGLLLTDWGHDRVVMLGDDGELRAVCPWLSLDRPYDAQQFDGAIVVSDSHHGRVVRVELDHVYRQRGH